MAKDDSGLKEFVAARRKGAEEIADRASAKGGPSKLTAAHFKAKAAPYKACLEGQKDKKDMLRRFKEILGALQSVDTMTQERFQQLMGEAEVYGEVYLASIGKKTVS